MKLSLRGKILSGYAPVLLLLVFVLTIAVANLRSLGQASAGILRENYRSIIAAESMMGAIERQNSAVLLVLLGYREEGLNQFRDNITVFLQSLGKATDNITIVGEDRVVAAIEQDYRAYLEGYESLLAALQTEPEAARARYAESLLPQFRKVRDRCGELAGLNQKAMYNASERAQRLAASVTGSLVAIGAAVLGAAVAWSLLLSRIIVEPLRRLQAGIGAIEKGDYDLELSSTSGDELGRLINDFGLMTRQLQSYRELNIGQIMAEKKKIETIIHTIDDGLLVVDTEGRVTDINATAGAILSVEKAEVEGAHFLEVLDNEQIFQQIKGALEKGTRFPGPGEENSLTVANGDRQSHYQFFVSPISHKPGKILGAILLLRDVTELQELNRLKSEFIMKASHELKNPLTGLAMSLSLLAEADASSPRKDQRELLDSAVADVNRLRAMVSDLLDLSRIEAGKLPLEIAQTSISVVIEQAAEMMRASVQQASIALGIEHPPDLPPVSADADKILWVLTNLVSNALRYTPGGGSIDITARDAGPDVEVSVRDTGAGIPPEYQARIFDKFFQVERGPGKTGSLGIGLAICKEIVNAHGGAIWVESSPGQGSTFSFTLHKAGQRRPEWKESARPTGAEPGEPSSTQAKAARRD